VKARLPYLLSGFTSLSGVKHEEEVAGYMEASQTINRKEGVGIQLPSRE